MDKQYTIVILSIDYYSLQSNISKINRLPKFEQCLSGYWVDTLLLFFCMHFSENISKRWHHQWLMLWSDEFLATAIFGNFKWICGEQWVLLKGAIFLNIYRIENITNNTLHNVSFLFFCWKFCILMKCEKRPIYTHFFVGSLYKST